MYLPVLDYLFVGVTLSERIYLLEDFKQVVGSIVILASPLSATSLDRLLGVPEGIVDSRTDLLHFKREMNPFWVDEKDIYKKLATQCIELLSMGEHFKKDICNLLILEKL
ncbi:hypothetical protein BOTNAR_0385g00020 [Botryotinia narcissicola]|uniref:Uncharacterized protein n=1 Tax=Botryotinia narcissicola TaxID=278944 RepID=A0A4Z1HPK3_9HELO|nr:hypothetical protein BOTNAR_0385g00020 [Botryotinia narcissicola]